MKLLSSQKAEGELIGHVIILVITIIGISMITLYGVPSIYSLEDMANLKNVEQAFTVMDSSASRAILGESPQQIANVNLGGGSLTVEPDSSASPSYIVLYDTAPTAETITIDNAGALNSTISSNNATVLNITNFSVNGTNRLLVVGLNYYTNPGITTVKYNNTDLTRARASKGNAYTELWYMINPPNGSFNISHTQTNATQVSMGAWSYTGVDSIGNITNATGTSTISRNNITTTAANSSLVDIVTSLNGITGPGAGQTQRYTNTMFNIGGAGSDMNTAPIGIYQMNWTLGGNADWAEITAEIKPVAIKIDNTGQSAAVALRTKLNLTNFNISSGANRLMVVGLSYSGDPGTTTVKYNSISLNFSRKANIAGAYVELWYLKDPPSGSYTIETNWTNIASAGVGAWSYTGVDQVTPIGNITNATRSGFTPNVDITTTVANSVLVDVEANIAAALAPGAGQNPAYIIGNTGGGSWMNASTIRTYNMNWTGASTSWAIIAAELKPQPVAITIDNAGASNSTISSNNATVLNITNFTVGSGANRLLVVGLNYYTNPGPTAVKYNNIDLFRAKLSNNGNAYAELWYMKNPPSGNSTIWHTQTTATQVSMGAWSYTGVDQVNPLGNITDATGTSTISRNNITTTAANSSLVDIVTSLNGIYGPGSAGQTQRYYPNPTFSIGGAGSDMNTTSIGIYQMNWTLGGNANWAEITAEIKQAIGVYFNITIPMGKIKYQLGDRIVAYEGGGVWSKYPSGSVMLSPPEFQFNGVTLTLPAINISGNTSVGGKGTATVSFNKKNATRVLYPDTSLTNPVSVSAFSKVYVNVTSDFYDAWADYARSLGYTKVVENPATRTTGIELTVLQAASGAPSSITDPVVMAGIDPTDTTPLDNFSFRLKPFKENINWDIRAGAGKKKLIFQFEGKVNHQGDTISLKIGYWENNNSYTETWERSGLFPSPTGEYVDVNLLDQSVTLTYNDITVGSDNSKDCQPFGSKIVGTGNDDFSWDDRIITTSTNKEQTLYDITQHYIGEMAQKGDIYFNQCSPGKKGDKAPSSDSTMLLNYNGVGAVYLHVSENGADVGIS